MSEIEENVLEEKPSTNQTQAKELDPLQDEIKKLREELAKEREAKQQIDTKLRQETVQRVSAEELAIDRAFQVATAEIDNLEKQQAALFEEGKFTEASKISRLIASAQYRLDDINNAKKKAEDNKNKPRENATQDPLYGFTPRARSWVQRNPAFLNDARFRAGAMAAHYAAEKDGVEIDSDEYFRRLDDAVNPKPVVEVREEQNDDVAPVSRQQARVSTAAPVSRSGGVTPNNTNSNAGRRIQLTAEEAEVARFTWPNLPPQDAYVRYADHKKVLREQGKL